MIAHRGASAAHAENTIEAFRGARALGADAVELDARRTAEGTLRVLHDAHLADGRALVDLADADVPAEVPSLAAALAACEGMDVNVEIKNMPPDPDFEPDELVAAQVVALVAELAMGPRILVSSFNLQTIDRVRQLDPALATAYLVLDAGQDTVDRTVRHGHGTYHPWTATVDQVTVAAAKDAGLVVNVWTVDDPDRMRELIAWGVDGIVTNVPDVARRVVDEG